MIWGIITSVRGAASAIHFLAGSWYVCYPSALGVTDSFTAIAPCPYCQDCPVNWARSHLRIFCKSQHKNRSILKGLPLQGREFIR